jgi:hypothetical protein
MSIINTLKTNWRELVTFFLLILALTVSGEIVYRLGGVIGLDLSSARNFLSGFARVSGVMLAVWTVVIGVSFTHTVQPFLRDHWVATFHTLPARERFYISCGVITLASLVCALCFSLGF